MTKAPDARSNSADREIVLTRVVNAPRELVWKVWTDPQHVGQWWGPNGFTTTTHSMDVRPGGTWHYIMHGPNGVDYLNRIQYLEVEEPARLVYRHAGEGETADVVFQTTTTFEDMDGRTLVTMRSVFPSVAERDRVEREFGAVEGGRQTLGRLDAYVSALR